MKGLTSASVIMAVALDVALCGCVCQAGSICWGQRASPDDFLALKDERLLCHYLLGSESAQHAIVQRHIMSESDMNLLVQRFRQAVSNHSEDIYPTVGNSICHIEALSPYGAITFLPSDQEGVTKVRSSKYEYWVGLDKTIGFDESDTTCRDFRLEAGKITNVSNCQISRQSNR